MIAKMSVRIRPGVPFFKYKPLTQKEYDMIDYVYDEVNSRWLISTKVAKFTAEGFIEHIDEFFREHGLPHTYYDIMQEKYDNLITTQYESVPGKNKKGNLIKTPALIQSWTTIILDYAQSFVYSSTLEQGKKSGIPSKEYEKNAVASVKAFSNHITGKPNLFGN